LKNQPRKLRRSVGSSPQYLFLSEEAKPVDWSISGLDMQIVTWGYLNELVFTQFLTGNREIVYPSDRLTVVTSTLAVAKWLEGLKCHLNHLVQGALRGQALTITYKFQLFFQSGCSINKHYHRRILLAATAQVYVFHRCLPLMLYDGVRLLLPFPCLHVATLFKALGYFCLDLRANSRLCSGC